MHDRSRPKAAPESLAAYPHHSAQLDEYGLLPWCCFRAHLDGRSLGYAEGIAVGRRQVQDESWSFACAIVNGAAKSVDILAARRKGYTIPEWAGGQR